MRVLLVEDEPLLSAQVHDLLRQAGYAVEVCDCGTDALFYGDELELDVAIVDLGLPDISGVQVIREWRAKKHDFPILILTARDHWQDKVEGLAAGADDYLVKPFHPEELKARVNALLRRSKGFSEATLVSGPIKLDTQRQLVFLHDKELDLTAYEYRVLRYLLMHPNKVISKTELTEHLYEQDFERDSNVIEVFVGRLRKKIDPDGTLKPIETLRGRGYRWRIPVT